MNETALFRQEGHARDNRRLVALELIDGGRSSAVRAGLQRLLREIRSALEADFVLLLYRQDPSGAAYVLGRCADEPDDLPLLNEPLVLDARAAAVRRPYAGPVVLTSVLRQLELELPRATVIPWARGVGHGWIVAAQRSDAPVPGRIDAAATRRFVEAVRHAHVVAGLRGATRLHRDLADAVDRIAEASVEADDVGSLFNAIAFAARTLLGTNVAYIAIPDATGRFCMSTLLNFRTGAFRRLSLAPWQGLGGLARERMEPVISSNYPEDRRLVDPPVLETLQEGLISAICVPLVVMDDVAGLLYTANRRLTPFTPADAALLWELALHAGRGLERARAAHQRVAVTRRLERERLVFWLHESVIHPLIEIGLEAETGIASGDEADARQALGRVRATAADCLDGLRENLADVVASSRGRPRDPGGGTTPTDVVETLASAPTRNLTARITLTDRADRPTLGTVAAEALVAVGREAIRNADLHSGGTAVDAALYVSATEATLAVTDDGAGLPAAPSASGLDGTAGHLGLFRMHRAAAHAGGTLALRRSAAGGLCVELTVPLGP